MKISFIVPVYNTYKYVNQCIKSILNQNIERYEIILVDDGSFDGAEKICDQYALQYKNIVSIHKLNGGLSETRNIGMQNITGDYVCFIDSDDYYSENSLKTIESFLNNIKSEDLYPDIIEFGYQIFREDKVERTVIPIKTIELVSGMEYLKQSTQNGRNYEWYVWKYVFKKTFLENINFSFKEGIKYEDVYTIPETILQASKVCTLNYIIYNYRLGRKNAITNGVNLHTEINKIEAVKHNIPIFQNLDDMELKNQLLNNVSLLFYSALIMVYDLKAKEEQKRLLIYLKKNKRIMSYTRIASMKQFIIKTIVLIIGLPMTSKLLYLRMRIKRGR